MKRMKALFFLIGIMLSVSGCMVLELSQPAGAPTEFAVGLPTGAPTRIPFPTQTPPLISLSPTPEIKPFPVWVTNFSNPILASLTGRRPEFQDDFSLLNRGWFFDVAGSPIGPYYARINDGALNLKLPEGKEKSDSMVYNPTLSRRNFVLSFDFRFGETQPDDYARFQYSPAKDQSFILDLSKNKNWNFRWGFNDDWKFRTGDYHQFPPERISVMFIVRENECAVYLNQNPLDYSNNCLLDPGLRRFPRAVSFHIIAIPGHNAIVNIDNVKMWDLDETPVFPGHP